MRVIAIDGPAGSGKSTVAKALAAKLGLSYLDTGAMYRAVTFAALRQGVDLMDPEAVAAVAHHMELDQANSVVVNGEDATEAIRSPEVTSQVSLVARNAAVRKELVARQRAWVAERGGGVLEGRDIGTVVFPDASAKIYLTASPEVRARRRSQELSEADVTRIAAEITERDKMDSERANDPLRQAEDALWFDTSDLTIEDVVAELMRLIDG
ncbi:MAG: (d)CMP kinase [Acidimicrobiia bacterium]